MHGRKRETLEASLARREATLPKVKLIRALQDDAIRRRTEKRYDAESMAVTGRLLEINPEVFTAWNFRREAIVRLAESTDERRRAAVAAQQSAAAARVNTHTTSMVSAAAAEDAEGIGEAGALSLDGASREASATPRAEADEKQAPFAPPLRAELALTERTLRKNPKSYPSWHHRKWTVRRMVEHARVRAADAAAAAAAADNDDETILLACEMKLCAALLELDDRNFHCWGYRRFVVGLRGAPDAEELEYTTRKIETNFSNYSAWHHRSTYLPRVHGGVQPGAAAAAASDCLPVQNAADTTAAAAKTTPADDASERTASQRRADLGRLPKEVLDAEYELVQQAFFTEPEDQSGWMYHRWLLGKTLGAQQSRVFGDDDDDDGDESKRSYDDEQGGPAEEVVEVLEREADLCRQLMEMEPDSKWPVVTLARLCRAKGPADQASQRESVGNFRRLVSLDPMRAGYYCDCCR